MRTTLFAIAALVASIAATPFIAGAQPLQLLNTGDNLPSGETSLKNVTGKNTTLKACAKENGLLVMFSCNTCPFVIKNQPITKKTIAYAAAHKIGVVVINSNEAQRGDADSYEAMQQYAKAQGYAVPYVIDENSKLANLFGANHTPEIFLFNNVNKLVYKGAMNDNPGDPERYKKMYIQDAIDALVAGKPIDPDATKSIGCSIKRKA